MVQNPKIADDLKYAQELLRTRREVLDTVLTFHDGSVQSDEFVIEAAVAVRDARIKLEAASLADLEANQ